MAAIEYRGLNAVTNFDLSRYIKWLKPNNNSSNDIDNNKSNINLCDINSNYTTNDQNSNEELEFSLLENETLSLNNSIDESTLVQPRPTSATSALELLLQSSKFKEMVEMASMTTNVSTTLESDQLSQCAFPDDIQAYFEYEDFNDGTILDDLNSIVPMFHFEGTEIL
jgi:AP2-like factor (ANT lineage)